MNNSTSAQQYPCYDYLYDKEYYSDVLYTNHFVQKELSYHEIQNGVIFPSIKVSASNEYHAVADREGKIFAGNLSGDMSEVILTALNDISVEKNHSTVIFLDAFGNYPYGHWFTDFFKRLWFLKSDTYRQRFIGCKIVYIPLRFSGFHGNYKRLFEIVGVNCDEFVPVTTITQYDRVIVPDECFFNGNDTVICGGGGGHKITYYSLENILLSLTR